MRDQLSDDPKFRALLMRREQGKTPPERLWEGRKPNFDEYGDAKRGGYQR